jgi:predicted esterase
VHITELNPIEKLNVSSKQFEDSIELNVTLPNYYYTKKDRQYVVLFDFHTRAQPYLSGLHDWLSHNGNWPWFQTIVVTPGQYGGKFARLYRQVNGEAGGDALLDSMEQDLLPAIDKNYRTNGYRIISGFTNNASVGLYALLNRPDMFNAYIAASPSLADDYAEFLSGLEDKLKQLNDKPRFLFISMGNRYYEKPHLEAYEKFIDILKKSAPKQSEWHAQRFDPFSYMVQPIMAIIHAVESLFKDINESLEPDSPIAPVIGFVDNFDDMQINQAIRIDTRDANGIIQSRNCARNMGSVTITYTCYANILICGSFFNFFSCEGVSSAAMAEIDFRWRFTFPPCCAIRFEA